MKKGKIINLIHSRFPSLLVLFSGLIINTLVGCQTTPAVNRPVSTITPEQTSPMVLHLTTGDFAPFSGETLPNQGLATEIVKRAFLKAGYLVDFTFLPWERGYNETLAGNYLGTFPYSQNAERQTLFLYSDPIYSFKVVFFAQSTSDIDFSQGFNLDGMHVCLPIGYNNFLTSQKNIDSSKIILDQPVDLAACFKMLQAGRTDVVMIMELVGWAVVDQTFGSRSDFKVLSPPLLETSDYLVISKNYPEGNVYMERFNTALKDLHQQGVIDQILIQGMGGD